MLQLKSYVLYYKRLTKNFTSRKKGYVRKHTKKIFLRNRDDETNNNLILQKEKQLLSSFVQLNSERARSNLIQGLYNKEESQSRIQSLINNFGNKITKPLEIAKLLNYRLPTLEKFTGLQQKTSILPKLLRESVSGSHL